MFYLAAFCRKPLAVAIFRACAFSPKISKKLLTFRFCYAILIKSANDMGEFPSGQRGQTVNLLSMTSLVRIQLPPPD